jgi:hypothetical protein
MKLVNCIVLISVACLISCTRYTQTSADLFVHTEEYFYEKYTNEYNKSVKLQEEYDLNIRQMSGDNPTHYSSVIHVSSLTDKQVLQYKLDFGFDTQIYGDHIDIVAINTIVTEALKKNPDVNVRFEIKLEEGETLQAFYTKSLKEDGLDAKGISEKVNFGVVQGRLPDSLYPFSLDKFRDATVWDLITIIEVVYDLKLYISDFSNVYLVAPEILEEGD